MEGEVPGGLHGGFKGLKDFESGFERFGGTREPSNSEVAGLGD